MRKLLIGLVAAGLCLALALPAMAGKITMGGWVQADVLYISRDAEAQAGGVPEGTDAGDDVAHTRFQIPYPLNRLNMRYQSDDGKIGGFIEIRGGNLVESPTTQEGTTVYWNYAWIDWRFNPNMYLRIGKQTQAFSINAAPQWVGFSVGHMLGNGYGNIHGGSSRDSVRLYWKFNDNVRAEFQLMDPDSDLRNLEIGVPQNPAIPGGIPGTVVEANTIPRIDIAVPITFGNFKIEPSFTYLSQEYENVAPGSDDSFDIYGLSLYVGFGMGMFEFKGEFNYGQNLGSGNYVGGAFCTPTVWVNNAGNAVVEDSDYWGGWINLGFKFGAAKLQIGASMQNTSNDGNPGLSIGQGDNLEFDIDRTSFWVNLPITVAKGYEVWPEFAYFDNGGSEKAGFISSGAGHKNADFGNEWLLGVSFKLIF